MIPPTQYSINTENVRVGWEWIIKIIDAMSVLDAALLGSKCIDEVRGWVRLSR